MAVALELATGQVISKVVYYLVAWILFGLEQVSGHDQTKAQAWSLSACSVLLPIGLVVHTHLRRWFPHSANSGPCVSFIHGLSTMQLLR